ncbi:GMP synthase (glutamine-hydrolysing) [Lishizhenia tianjinensis]|uniref:GMP synthase (Glutamine-hydrolysing) n=1 Tax=Lishizhenia tianjinensis TaxID=477690 RepID=A0A1I6YQT5_9FLAO|nr:gamma-glutamyl-gamma-aminobutyrate hydrolase family protein [Lishizhenia tianjinensis]SFT52837.1 GMP synthase (glutamine-hydrolysing) [Lishizhenia tianjinensis]
MILIVNCGSNKVPYLEDIVNDHMDFTTVSMYDVAKTDLSSYKGVIISGAPILISQVNPDPYLEAFSFIKEIEIPVLGICFGHQILGMVFDAFPALEKEDRDWQTISFYEDSPLLTSIPKEVLMMEDHTENISIPPGFMLLGGSDQCVNEAMQHRQRPLYGVQFHPEVSGNMGARLIENFVNICRNHAPAKDEEE